MRAIGIDTLPADRDGSPEARDNALLIQGGADLLEAADSAGRLIEAGYTVAHELAQLTEAALFAASDTFVNVIGRDRVDVEEMRKSIATMGSVLNNQEKQNAGVCIWVLVQGDVYLGNKLMATAVQKWMQVALGKFPDPTWAAYAPNNITGLDVKNAIENAESNFGNAVAKDRKHDGEW